MKTTRYIGLALVLSAITLHAVVPTVSEQLKQTAKETVATAVNSETVQIAKTNLNSVMIDILSGVRDAGKEMYGASKDAIHSSVNFAQEQAPLVVKEFLRWHMARAILNAIGFLIPIVVLLYLARKLYKHASSDSHAEELYIPSCILMVIAFLFLTLGVGPPVMTVTKIAVAPKVYIIEYVVETIQGDHRTSQTR